MNVTGRRRMWHSLNDAIKNLRFDDAVMALERELRSVDGFPTRGDGAGRGTSELTSVEAAAGRALPLSRDIESVDRALQSIEAEVRRLRTVLDKYAGPAPVVTDRLCEVAAYHDPWAEPRTGESFPCTELMEHTPAGSPRKDRLCAKHRKRKERFEREQAIVGAA